MAIGIVAKDEETPVGQSLRNHPSGRIVLEGELSPHGIGDTPQEAAGIVSERHLTRVISLSSVEGLESSIGVVSESGGVETGELLLANTVVLIKNCPRSSTAWTDRQPGPIR